MRTVRTVQSKYDPLFCGFLVMKRNKRRSEKTVRKRSGEGESRKARREAGKRAGGTAKKVIKKLKKVKKGVDIEKAVVI